MTLLGGEPFLHPGLPDISRYAKAIGMRVDICTNGYGISSALDGFRDSIDNLRVSIDGLERSNDAVRCGGSFASALQTVRHAVALDIRTSVTVTVTALCLGEMGELARLLSDMGVCEMKLHRVRRVGNAVAHDDLIPVGHDPFAEMHGQLREACATLPISVAFDVGLSPLGGLGTTGQAYVPMDSEVERVEIQPDGQLFMSCKAVGADGSAFHYDKKTGRIEYRPKADDELATKTPHVRFARLIGKDRE